MQIVLATLGLGAFWIAVEFGHLAVSDSAFELRLELPRFARYAMLQLMILAVPALMLRAWRRRFSPAVLSWTASMLMTLVLLGPVAALAIYRSPGIPLALIAATASAFAAVPEISG